MAARQTILIFDSGLGGLTVYREVVAARPDTDFVYVADDAGFPYGAKREDELIERVVRLMGELIATHRPDLVVVACNTASTIVLPALRKTFPLPFVGTVPAIKPACAGSVTRRVSVLGTEATVAREYTHALIREYAGDCQVTLVGAKNLAGYAEAELAGAPASDAEIAVEIAPAFATTAPHRHRRTSLHPLSPHHRAPAAARPLAGQFHRPGSGDCPAGRLAAWAGAQR
jgi:glutamate racemase